MKDLILKKHFLKGFLGKCCLESRVGRRWAHLLPSLSSPPPWAHQIASIYENDLKTSIKKFLQLKIPKTNHSEMGRRGRDIVKTTSLDRQPTNRRIITLTEFSPRSEASKTYIGLPSWGVLHREDGPPQKKIWLWRSSFKGLVYRRTKGL